jgi:tetratricopeptide (TPR) repeat protein
MNQLGNGLYAAERDEEALSVGEADLATLQRLGAPEHSILNVQNNLASSYSRLGRREEAVNAFRDVYSGYSKLLGEEAEGTLIAANNYASMLKALNRHDEVKTLMRKTLPVARRVLGDSNALTLRMRWIYAQSLCRADGATLDDVREAVTTLEEIERTGRRVLGGANPLVAEIERDMIPARAALRACDAAAAGH